MIEMKMRIVLSLPLGHTAVESAEGEAPLTKRFCSKGDECLPKVIHVGYVPATVEEVFFPPAGGSAMSDRASRCSPTGLRAAEMAQTGGGLVQCS
jgi:hypothetical protein